MLRFLPIALLLALSLYPSQAQQPTVSLVAGTDPQTWIRVTLGKGYAKPMQVHISGIRWRPISFTNYRMFKEGSVRLEDGPAVKPQPVPGSALLLSGDNTGWCNISEIVPASGALLRLYPLDKSGVTASHFNGTIEFATRPEAAAVVKKYDVDYDAPNFSILVPSNLENQETAQPFRVRQLLSDWESAQEYGAIADQYKWPTFGKKPVRFPFTVEAHFRSEETDSRIMEREMKTLSYFGFSGIAHSGMMGEWGSKHTHIWGPGKPNGSYQAYDREKQREKVANSYKKGSARILKQNLSYAKLMDEPFGESLATLATDGPSIEAFRAWIKSLELTPAQLEVDCWEEVKPVTDKQRDTHPMLYYYSHQFRTITLGQYMEMQANLIRDVWKRDFPIVSNFSDGAIAAANFYAQGVDYFKLLHGTNQNAIWSEDWSNGGSTYQNAAYNVELMRAAARKKGQVMGHYLIAYKHRAGHDVRLKAISGVARGIKIFRSYIYGPQWTTYESNTWQSFPNEWGGQVAAIHEIGAVEDYLLPAMPQKAEVALLYSSASDIWNLNNWSYGFERMHTWLALTHAQIPVDVVHEDEVADEILNGYKVCYLADTNITREAAQKLSAWVKAGGTLIMTAGAGTRDEFNRPLNTLDSLLPYERNATQALQAYHSSGRNLTALKPRDTIPLKTATLNVLGSKQTFSNVRPGPNVSVQESFSDGSPAQIRSTAGKGAVISKGYLPALDYMRQALEARDGVVDAAKRFDDSNTERPGEEDLSATISGKSYNPWQYPAEIRGSIVKPAKNARLKLPLTCSVPLVDAVYMTSDKGILIPLANYTLQPIKTMSLEIQVNKPFREVRSVHQGTLEYEKLPNNKIRVRMPLELTDFIIIE